MSVASAVTRVPDRGWGWCVTLGVTLHMFLRGVMQTGFSLIFEMMRDRFGSSAQATAWVYSLHDCCVFFSGNVWKYYNQNSITDTYSPKHEFRWIYCWWQIPFYVQQMAHIHYRYLTAPRSCVCYLRCLMKWRHCT